MRKYSSTEDIPATLLPDDHKPEDKPPRLYNGELSVQHGLNEIRSREI